MTPSGDLRSAYEGRRVLVTGHTGFKGSWLTVWLETLGARVTGLSLPPGLERSLFHDAGIEELAAGLSGDIREEGVLEGALAASSPEAVFHLAAQSLVRRSYRNPLETFETNVLGTWRILEAIRRQGRASAVVVVTSDKCYESAGTPDGHREEDALGGHDPYSASKAAAEIVVGGYRRSFFPPDRLAGHGVALASARAGNVLGGGDWGEDRLIPDAARALEENRPVPVRNPDSVRPWQHVLEPLSGYLQLGARLMDRASGAAFCQPWNFGPRPENARPVRDVVEEFLAGWGGGRWEDRHDAQAPHEAVELRLSAEKARTKLGWNPRWGFEETIARTAAWYRRRADGANRDELLALLRGQIADYGAGDGARAA
jgi:CDP-glucose 4,6-dehydratase